MNKILRGYDERIYRMRGQEFQMSYRLQKWFKSERFFNMLMWLVSKNKPLAMAVAYDTNLKKQLWSPKWWWKVITNKL